MRRPRSPADALAWLTLAGLGFLCGFAAPWLLTAVVVSIAVLWSVQQLFMGPDPEVTLVQRDDKVIAVMRQVSLQAEKHWDQLPHALRTSVVAMRRELSQLDR